MSCSFAISALIRSIPSLRPRIACEHGVQSSPKSSVEFHSSGLLVLVLLVERGLLAEGVARSKQAPLKRLRR